MRSGAEPQPPAILVHFYIKRKVLMPLKSTIWCCGGVARKLSFMTIQIPNHFSPNSLEIVVRSYIMGFEGGAPATNDNCAFWFEKEICGALMVYRIVHWCSQESPAANDFCAFLDLKRSFR